MNKQQFLDTVRLRLAGLSQNDIERWLDYYAEMIDDRVEDGIDEVEAVAAMGSPEYVASQILMDTPLPKLIKAKATPSFGLRTWEFVLLILGSPVWLPLLLAGIVAVLSLLFGLGAVILSMYIVVLALGVRAVACFIAIFQAAAPTPIAALAGAGLICIGVSILLLLAMNRIVKGIAWLFRQCIRRIKAHFVRKGDVQ